MSHGLECFDVVVVEGVFDGGEFLGIGSIMDADGAEYH